MLRYRFGMAGGREHTLGEIGVKLGRSRERVRQIQEIALEKLSVDPDVLELRSSANREVARSPKQNRADPALGRAPMAGVSG